MKKDDNRARFTLRIPMPLFDALKGKAGSLGIQINPFILSILWDWAEKHCYLNTEKSYEQGG